MKKDALTIPNIISLARICMIPVFVGFYFSKHFANNYYIALAVLLLSGLSDIVDGFIARKFDMVSDVGKVLDPIADKLTQVAVVFCLVFFHRELMLMVIVLCLKELLTLFAAVFFLTGGNKPFSSKWFGKLATVMVYLTFFYALLVDISAKVPKDPLVIISIVSTICLVLSMAGYIITLINISQDSTKD